MMKKIFALVFAIIVVKCSFSQGYPLQQSLGSDSTIVISKGALQSRLVPIVITDTNAANAQRLKSYPGAQLYTTAVSVADVAPVGTIDVGDTSKMYGFGICVGLTGVITPPVPEICCA